MPVDTTGVRGKDPCCIDCKVVHNCPSACGTVEIIIDAMVEFLLHGRRLQTEAGWPGRFYCAFSYYYPKPKEVVEYQDDDGE